MISENQGAVALADAVNPCEDQPLRRISDVFLVDLRIDGCDHPDVRANCLGREPESVLVADELVPYLLVALTSSGHPSGLGARIDRHEVVDLQLHRVGITECRVVSELRFKGYGSQ